jgi:hypothetical protein
MFELPEEEGKDNEGARARQSRVPRDDNFRRRTSGRTEDFVAVQPNGWAASAAMGGCARIEHGTGASGHAVT